MSKEEAEKPKKGVSHKAVIGAIAAVVLVAACGGGYYAWNSHRQALHAQAIGSCQNEAKQLKTVNAAYTESVKAAAVKPAKDVTVKQDSCDAEAATDQLNKNAADMKTQAAKITEQNGKLESQTKKTLNDDLANANNVLGSTDGKVADNATRDALTNAINASKKAASDKKATVKSLTDAKASLDNAVNAVNASVQAKAQADATAAQQAQDAQAQAQAAQSSGSNGCSGYSGGSYSGSGYSAVGSGSSYSGGYSAPHYNAPAPSGGNGDYHISENLDTHGGGSWNSTPGLCVGNGGDSIGICH